MTNYARESALTYRQTSNPVAREGFPPWFPSLCMPQKSWSHVQTQWVHEGLRCLSLALSFPDSTTPWSRLAFYLCHCPRILKVLRELSEAARKVGTAWSCTGGGQDSTRTVQVEGHQRQLVCHCYHRWDRPCPNIDTQNVPEFESSVRVSTTITVRAKSELARFWLVRYLFLYVEYARKSLAVL